LKNFNVGQWVWYWGKNSICNAAITKIENGKCIFETEGCPRVEVEEKRCYLSIEEMIKKRKCQL